MAFEYSVVPAPKKGMKAKGVKTTEDRFAHALQQIMNDKGADGWEYLRTDTLPSEERQGLTGRTTTYQNMMVFRRATAPVTAEAPVALLTAAPQTARRDQPDMPASEPALTARTDRKMMDLEASAPEGDPLRAEPTLRAD